MAIFCSKSVKRAFSDAIMTSCSKMTAFSDFENASNVFLATFSVVYGMKLEQKVALDGSNCRKWWHFADNGQTAFFDVRMTSYSKMTEFSDF